MFFHGSPREEDADTIYAKAGRRMLDGSASFGSLHALEFKKSLDRHSAAMERLAAVLEKTSVYAVKKK